MPARRSSIVRAPNVRIVGAGTSRSRPVVYARKPRHDLTNLHAVVRMGAKNTFDASAPLADLIIRVHKRSAAIAHLLATQPPGAFSAKSLRADALEIQAVSELLRPAVADLPEFLLTAPKTDTQEDLLIGWRLSLVAVLGPLVDRLHCFEARHRKRNQRARGQPVIKRAPRSPRISTDPARAVERTALVLGHTVDQLLARRRADAGNLPTQASPALPAQRTPRQSEMPVLLSSLDDVGSCMPPISKSDPACPIARTVMLAHRTVRWVDPGERGGRALVLRYLVALAQHSRHGDVFDEAMAEFWCAWSGATEFELFWDACDVHAPQPAALIGQVQALASARAFVPALYMSVMSSNSARAKGALSAATLTSDVRKLLNDAHVLGKSFQSSVTPVLHVSGES